MCQTWDRQYDLCLATGYGTLLVDNQETLCRLSIVDRLIRLDRSRSAQGMDGTENGRGRAGR